MCHHVNWTLVAAGSLRWLPAMPWKLMQDAVLTWTSVSTGDLKAFALRLAMEVCIYRVVCILLIGPAIYQ